MILIIDNYDSFTYNLVQIFEQYAEDVKIIRNDSHTVEEIVALAPDAIVLSPGPCTPKESGICPDVVRAFHDKVPMLGVCLGHQVIGDVFGATVKGADNIIHGKLDVIHHDASDLFENIEPDFTATRYHSLIIDPDTLTDELCITARAKMDNTIMSVKHREYPVYGLQFHPESYGTKEGVKIIRNFIKIIS